MLLSLVKEFPQGMEKAKQLNAVCYYEVSGLTGEGVDKLCCSKLWKKFLKSEYETEKETWKQQLQLLQPPDGTTGKNDSVSTKILSLFGKKKH